MALAGRRVETLEATLSELPAEPEAFAVPTDVTAPTSVEALFEAVVDRAGRVDVLINNAGVFGPPAPVEDVAHADWSAAVQTNLTGAFLCAQAAFRQMIRQSPSGGRIVNNGSLSAHVPRPNAVAYTATKHGITGLTKALALEGRAPRDRLRPDRHRQRRDRHDQAARGRRAPGRRIDRAPSRRCPPRTSPTRCCTWSGSRSSANVLSMTVMASGMPFVGRG